MECVGGDILIKRKNNIVNATGGSTLKRGRLSMWEESWRFCPERGSLSKVHDGGRNGRSDQIVIEKKRMSERLKLYTIPSYQTMTALMMKKQPKTTKAVLLYLQFSIETSWRGRIWWVDTPELWGWMNEWRIFFYFLSTNSWKRRR